MCVSRRDERDLLMVFEVPGKVEEGGEVAHEEKTFLHVFIHIEEAEQVVRQAEMELLFEFSGEGLSRGLLRKSLPPGNSQSPAWGPRFLLPRRILPSGETRSAATTTV